MLLYVIEFPNGKRYFGITDRKLSLRWSNHLSDAKRKNKRPICAALSKYPDATIRALVVGHREYIHDLEFAAIEAFDTTDRRYGYNVGLGGEINPMRGNRHSEESKAKISAASKALIRTDESNAKRSATLKGRPICSERRAKISVATKAAMAKLGPIVISDETRSRMSVAQKGKTRSLEHMAKCHAGARNYRHTPEALKRIGDASRTRVRTAETREKIRSAMVGRKFSDETIAKMRVAAKNRVKRAK